MRNDFNWKQSLLTKLKSTSTPMCFCLDMGIGKSETVKYYLQHNTTKKILLILNNIDEINEFQDHIGEEQLTIWHSKTGTKFHELSIQNNLAITKQKFFKLLIHREYEFFKQFDEYVYDEFSGLSPLTVTELVDDINLIMNQLRYSKQVDYIIKLSRFFQDIVSYINKDIFKDGTTYQCPLQDTTQQYAQELLTEYWTFRQSTLAYQTSTIDQSIIIILQAIVNNSMFISKFQSKKNQQKYAIAVKDDTIKEFIKDKKFIILDATARFNEYVYKYLDIPIDYDFPENLTHYNHLDIHIHHIQGITHRNLRKYDKDALDKLSQTVKDQIHTFVPKNIYDPFIEKFGFDKEHLQYFFSGKDVGSNDLREEVELNIVALQTYPKIMRTVYNHVFFGMTLEAANRIENDKSEWYLLSRNLVQLIGRVRVLNKDFVKINLYCILAKFAYLAKELHFKDCNIISHTTTQTSRNSRQQILDLIEIKLQNETERDYVYIDDLIKVFISKKDTQNNFYYKNKKVLIEIGNKLNWTYSKPRGKRPFFEKNDISRNTDKILISEFSQDVTKIFDNIFNKNTNLEQSLILTKYIKKRNCSKRTAQRHLKKALEQRILTKEGKYYTLNQDNI